MWVDCQVWRVTFDFCLFDNVFRWLMSHVPYHGLLCVRCGSATAADCPLSLIGTGLLHFTQSLFVHVCGLTDRCSHCAGLVRTEYPSHCDVPCAPLCHWHSITTPPTTAHKCTISWSLTSLVSKHRAVFTQSHTFRALNLLPCEWTLAHHISGTPKRHHHYPMHFSTDLLCLVHHTPPQHCLPFLPLWWPHYLSKLEADDDHPSHQAFKCTAYTRRW